MMVQGLLRGFGLGQGSVRTRVGRMMSLNVRWGAAVERSNGLSWRGHSWATIGAGTDLLMYLVRMLRVTQLELQ